MEQTFGVLKGCFRILLKTMEIGLENSAKTIITCCIFHSMCQLRGDFCINDDNVLDQVLRNERIMRRVQQAYNNVTTLLATTLSKDRYPKRYFSRLYREEDGQ